MKKHYIAYWSVFSGYYAFLALLLLLGEPGIILRYILFSLPLMALIVLSMVERHRLFDRLEANHAKEWGVLAGQWVRRGSDRYLPFVFSKELDQDPVLFVIKRNLRAIIRILIIVGIVWFLHCMSAIG